MRELRDLLDEELDRLPEMYRAPLVLCYLEGKSYVEAARLLGWRNGTVCGRLARARELLRQRLSHRGLTLSGAAMVAALSEPSSAPATMVAAVSRMAALFALGQTTAGTVSPSVATLAQGVLQAMSIAKLKIAVVLIVVLGMFAAGAGWTAHWVLTETPAEGQPAAQTPKTETAPQAGKDYYGDPLPPGVVARMGSMQLRQEMAHLAFSADSKTLISAGWDGTVRFWDMATGRQARRTRIPLSENPPSQPDLVIAGLAPNGKVLAVFEGDSLDLYDIRTREKLSRLPAAGDGHKRLSFSADGKLLAALIGIADNYALRLWDLSTGKERFRLEKLNQAGNSLVLSPDGSRLAYQTDENERVLHVHDTTTGRELAKGPVEGWCFAFSPDSQTLAAAMNFENNTMVTLWETAGLKKRATLRPSRVTKRIIETPCLTFSPDGKLLVMGGLEALVVWDVSAGKERLRLDDRRAKEVLFSPDGKTLASAGKFEIRLWDIGTGERLHGRAGHDSHVGSVAVSPDGRIVASTAWSDSLVRLWDADTGKPLPLVPQHDSWIRSCAFAPDGRLVISGGFGVVRLLDAGTGAEQRRFVITDRKTGKQNHEILVSHLSSDGKRLAVISTAQEQRQLTLWDASTGELLVRRPFDGSLDSRFTADSKGVTVDSRERLLVEDTKAGQPLAVISGDLGHPVAFTSGAQIAAVGIHKTEAGPMPGYEPLGVRVIEMASREELFHVDGWIDYTAFSPDGHELATAGADGLRLWDVVSGELLLRRSWPANSVRRPLLTPIHSLAFLPNGRAVVTGMNDGTLLVWDMTPPPRKPDKARDLCHKDLNMLWSDLAGYARKAHRAIYTLAAVPKQALPFLAEHLHPAVPVDMKRVDKLLADLDSEQFAVRDTAARELESMGPQIEPALQRVLENKPSLEVRNRVRAIQEKQRGVPPTATLRTLRAIRVLEAIGTTEARRLLHKLTSGAVGARETREAKAALERLARHGS
jgi:WD40 repeat protein